MEGSCAKVKSGAKLAKTSMEVLNTVGAWHEKQRDLCLLLTRRLATPVSLRLSYVHKQGPEKRLRDDCQYLANTASLKFAMDIPDAAAPLHVVADLHGRTVTCSMKVDAPEDRKSAKARINWLTRQLADSDPNDIFVKAIWPGGSANTMESLSQIREDPKNLLKEGSRLVPSSFVVMSVTDLAGRFSARRKFVEEMSEIVPGFYENVGENLRNWVPPPPRIKDEKESSTLEVAAG